MFKIHTLCFVGLSLGIFAIPALTFAQMDTPTQEHLNRLNDADTSLDTDSEHEDTDHSNESSDTSMDIHTSDDEEQLSATEDLVQNNALTDFEPASVLHTAIRQRNIIKLRSALENPIDCNTKSSQGNTPLCVAACLNLTEAVRILLKAQADPNQGPIPGKMPLHYATEHQNFEVIRLLCNAGVSKSLHHQDSQGYTVFHTAAATPLNSSSLLLTYFLVIALAHEIPEALDTNDRTQILKLINEQYAHKVNELAVKIISNNIKLASILVLLNTDNQTASQLAIDQTIYGNFEPRARNNYVTAQLLNTLLAYAQNLLRFSSTKRARDGMPSPSPTASPSLIRAPAGAVHTSTIPIHPTPLSPTSSSNPVADLWYITGQLISCQTDNTSLDTAVIKESLLTPAQLGLTSQGTEPNDEPLILGGLPYTFLKQVLQFSILQILINTWATQGSSEGTLL